MSEPSNTPRLDRVRHPADSRNLSAGQLKQLAGDLHAETVNPVSVTGGHPGALLGVVELTVALHPVFDTPQRGVERLGKAARWRMPDRGLGPRRRLTIERLAREHAQYSPPRQPDAAGLNPPQIVAAMLRALDRSETVRKPTLARTS